MIRYTVTYLNQLFSSKNKSTFLHSILISHLTLPSDNEEVEETEEDMQNKQELEEAQYDDYQDASSQQEEEAEAKYEGPLASSLSRSDMLGICSNFNRNLKAANKKKDPARGNAATQLLARDKTQHTKDSFVSKTMKDIESFNQKAVYGQIPKPKKKLVKNREPIPEVVRATPDTSPARPIRRATSFSEILNESEPKLSSNKSSPDPPPAPFKEKERTYTKEEVDALVKKHRKVYTQDEVEEILEKKQKEEEDAMFTTSTPLRKPSPIPPAFSGIKTPPRLNTASRSSPRIIEMNQNKDKSVIKQIEDSVSSRKELFKADSPSMSLSLESIPPPSKCTAPDANVEMYKQFASDMIKVQTDIVASTSNMGESVATAMKENMLQVQKDIVSSTRDMGECVAKAMRNSMLQVQIEMVSSTRDMGQSVAKNIKDSMLQVVDGISTAMYAQAKENTAMMKDTMETQIALLVDGQKKQTQVQSANTEMIQEINEKLTDKILLLQINLVKGMDDVSKAVEDGALTMKDYNHSMVKGMNTLNEVTTKMTTSMVDMIVTAKALNERQEEAVLLLNKVDQVVCSVVNNLDELGKSEERINKEYIKRMVNKRK